MLYGNWKQIIKHILFIIETSTSQASGYMQFWTSLQKHQSGMRSFRYIVGIHDNFTGKFNMLFISND